LNILKRADLIMKNIILIVDSDKNSRRDMREFVEMSGFSTLVAQSGEDGLGMLLENDIDVIITDTDLSGMDGLELTDLVKVDYDTDVIVLTDYRGDYSYEEAISKGASDFIFKPVRFEELLLRLNRVLRERRLNAERLSMLKRLKELSITDGLTKLFNSRHFYNQLKNETDRSARYKHPLSLLILDIDHFKDYNDTYGHLEGDKVLIRLGQVIKLLLRKMDSAYRYGGEEFTIILPETEIEEAETVAQRIRRAVKETVFSSAHPDTVTITVSIGMTQYQIQEDIKVFVQRADKALYNSKSGGRDQVSAL
jgi:diguanylate cyclase (GGDEF)-like protein